MKFHAPPLLIGSGADVQIVVCGSNEIRSFNPATGAVTKHVPLATSAEVDAAVAAAKAALPGWASTPPHVRARVMFRFRDLVEQNGDLLAGIINNEHGKVLSDARGEVTRGNEVVEFACGIPQMLKGEFSENVGRGVDAISVRQPLGVVAGITPFNFPVMVPMWMFPVALACGNTFVLKISEKVPSAALVLARLLTEAGLPPGVFNVVHGDKEAVDGLLRAKRPLMADAMLRPFFEAYEIVADVLCDAPTDISDKDLTKQALGVGGQYAAQGRIRNSESVSALLFATARQVAADQKLLEPSTDLPERRRDFLNELRGIIGDMDRVHGLATEQFYVREAQLHP